MNRRLSVTIGISAYNEAACIGNLLTAIAKQQSHFANINKIILIDDASSDRTAEVAENLNIKNFKLVRNRLRIGKSRNINRIIRMTATDILIILDADIVLNQIDMVDTLIQPFTANSKLMLTAGNSHPVSVDNFAAKSVYTGLLIWKEIINRFGSDMYKCGGQVRAFRKPLYKILEFPDKSADDVYPYLVCMNNGWDFRYVPESMVNFYLPQSLSESAIQQARFLHSKKIQSEIFPDKILKKYYNINSSHKLKILSEFIIKQPIWTMSYLFLTLLSRIAFYTSSVTSSSTWDMAKSTKGKFV